MAGNSPSLTLIPHNTYQHTHAHATSCSTSQLSPRPTQPMHCVLHYNAICVRLLQSSVSLRLDAYAKALLSQAAAVPNMHNTQPS